jgi:multiple sugar transport system ATP-binding protein
MNVFDGVLRLKDGFAWVQAHGHHWPVGEIGSGKDGQAVHYGVRPGDIGIGDAASGIAARVVVVELTGAETELLLQVGESKLIVVLHGRIAVAPDDMVGLQIDAEKSHLFDHGSGERLAAA